MQGHTLQAVCLAASSAPTVHLEVGMHRKAREIKESLELLDNLQSIHFLLMSECWEEAASCLRQLSSCPQWNGFPVSPVTLSLCSRLAKPGDCHGACSGFSLLVYRTEHRGEDT